MARQQPALRPRDAIPRQMANRLEEARAERVVQVAGLQLLWRALEIADHVRLESVDQRAWLQRSPLHARTHASVRRHPLTGHQRECVVTSRYRQRF